LNGQQVIRQAMGGVPETFIGGPGVNAIFIPGSPSAIAIDPSGNVYVASPRGGICTVYRVTQDRKVSMQTFGGYTDSIAVDASGKLYGTDSFSGLLGFNYWDGNQVFGFEGDGGPVLSAAWNSPSRLILSPSGNFYFIDTGNERVRKISGSPPSQAPVISAAGVVNAAGGTGPTIAPGEVISVYGSNLGPASGWFNSPDNNVFPSVAGYSRLLFDGHPAPILVATANQINAFVPYNILPGKVTSVQVEADGVLSDSIRLNIAKAAFGLFTANNSGAGQGAILNQDTSYNSASHPAERGSIITLYGTGEGLTMPTLPDGALVLSTPYSKPEGPVTVMIGGQSSEVLYAGAAPFLATGIMQINARVPAGIAPGDAPIVVSIGGLSTTRPVTVAIR